MGHAKSVDVRQRRELFSRVEVKPSLDRLITIQYALKEGYKTSELITLFTGTIIHDVETVSGDSQQ